jgi:hypothetical protein
VAPTKKITLPRLELLRALLASRLMNYVLKALTTIPESANIFGAILLRLDKRKHQQMEAFRTKSGCIKEIRAYSQPDQWHYCPGGENPADLASRGCTAKDLLASKPWIAGPEWLLQSIMKRQTGLPPPLTTPEKEVGNVKERKGSVFTAVSLSSKPELLVLSQYSSFHRGLRITAWVFSVSTESKKNKVKDAFSDKEVMEKVRLSKTISLSISCLTAQELEKEEIFWIRCAQMAAYPRDFQDLRNGKELNRHSPIRTLKPQFDHKNGVMPVTSRLADTFEFEELAPPILLPIIVHFPADRIVRLLVWKKHVESLHGGVSLLLAKLRQH